MSPFTYQEGAYHAYWDPYEITVFAAISRAAIEALQNSAKTDSIRKKLLPPLSTDDGVAAEFQRLAGQQIADAKIELLTQFALLLVENLPGKPVEGDRLIEVVIPPGQTQLALQALTNLRVYLGAKLEIETDEDSEILYHLMEAAADGDQLPQNLFTEQRAFLASVFFASGFVQETLVEAVMATPQG